MARPFVGYKGGARDYLFSPREQNRGGQLRLVRHVSRGRSSTSDYSSKGGDPILDLKGVLPHDTLGQESQSRSG